MLIRATKTPVERADTWGLGVGHYRRRSEIPRWLVCDADEFINRWLPKFDRRELPPVTDEEWNRIKRILHMSE